MKGDCCSRYATERKTMGTQIINHQSVANLIADMAVGVETARLMVLKSAFDVDAGRRNTYYASIAKVLQPSYQLLHNSRNNFNTAVVVSLFIAKP